MKLFISKYYPKIIFAIIILNLILLIIGVKTSNEQKSQLILNMVIRNNEGILEKCLNSVVDLIDEAVICDVRSYDKSVQILKVWGRKYKKRVKIVQLENYDRNICLKEIENKEDYILLFDPQLELKYEQNYNFDELKRNLKTRNRFMILEDKKGVISPKTMIINKIHSWHYDQDDSIINEDILLKGLTIKHKVRKIENQNTINYFEDPTSRNANTFLVKVINLYHSKEYEKALSIIQKLDSIKSLDVEVRYYSKLLEGTIYIEQDKEEKIIEHVMNQTYSLNTLRAEPFYRLSKYYEKKNKIQQALSFSKAALSLYPPPKTFKNVHKSEYRELPLGLLCSLSYLAFFFDEGLSYCQQLYQISPSSLVKEKIDFYTINYNPQKDFNLGV